MILALKLDRDGPLQEQLFDQLCRMIDGDVLAVCQRMPSTRALAEQYGLSRMTVLLTYERLVAAGYLQTVPAGGTYVSAERRGPRVATGGRPGAGNGSGRYTNGSHRPDAPAEGWPLSLPAPELCAEPLPVDAPGVALFPSARWRKLLRTELARMDLAKTPIDTAGNRQLRRSIASWLHGSRGLDVSADQIVLVSARGRAQEIVAQLLLGPGAWAPGELAPRALAIIETPGDPVATGLYRAAGAQLFPVPVDAEGLVTQLLPAEGGAVAHVTPAFQQPLGVALSPRRRHELAQWAERTQTTLVEADRAADLHYDHVPEFSLGSLPGSHQVIYIGDFADVLAPLVTTSFMVLPLNMVARALAAKRQLDQHVEWFADAALAKFMESGAYLRHLRQLRKVYGDRRVALLERLRFHFGDVEPRGVRAGLCLAWRVADSLGSAAAIASLAVRSGLAASVVGNQAGLPADMVDRVVLLGFGLLDEAQLGRGVDALARLLRPTLQCAPEQHALEVVNE